MVFRQPYAAIRRKAYRKCDYSKIITPKMGLLSNYCFLIINYCYSLAILTGVLVCFSLLIYPLFVKKCNFCIGNGNFYVLFSKILKPFC